MVYSMIYNVLCLVQVRLRTEVLSIPSSNHEPSPDHGSTFHVTETSALSSHSAFNDFHAHLMYGIQFILQQHYNEQQKKTYSRIFTSTADHIQNLARNPINV